MKASLFALALLAAAPTSAAPRTETAVLAGGCFWGMESVFEHVKGVKDVVSGYAGGGAKDANYDAVSSESTGHAEAVRSLTTRRRSAMPSFSKSILRSRTIRPK